MDVDVENLSSSLHLDMSAVVLGTWPELEKLAHRKMKCLLDDEIEDNLCRGLELCVNEWMTKNYNCSIFFELNSASPQYLRSTSAEENRIKTQRSPVDACD